jgi:hypothetical protein
MRGDGLCVIFVRLPHIIPISSFPRSNVREDAVPFIDYDITQAQRNEALRAILARKSELDVGMPTLCYNMQKKVGAARDRVRMIDGAPINVDAINHRDLHNFAAGRKTTAAKLYVILAYLALLEN